MNIEESKKELRATIKMKPITPYIEKGGQHCGLPIQDVILFSEEMGIEIKVAVYRSKMRNEKLAMKLFNYAIDITFN